MLANEPEHGTVQLHYTWSVSRSTRHVYEQLELNTLCTTEHNQKMTRSDQIGMSNKN